MNESFSNLPIKWKILISLGIVFTIISFVLIVVLAIMSETDLLGYKLYQNVATDQDLEEFDELFKDFGKEVKEVNDSTYSSDSADSSDPADSSDQEEITENYNIKIKDLDNKYLLDLLEIRLL